MTDQFLLLKCVSEKYYDDWFSLPVAYPWVISDNIKFLSFLQIIVWMFRTKYPTYYISLYSVEKKLQMVV